MDEMNKWVTLCDRYAQQLKRLNAEDNRASSPARFAEDISAISSGSMPVVPVELLKERPEV